MRPEAQTPTKRGRQSPRAFTCQGILASSIKGTVRVALESKPLLFSFLAMKSSVLSKSGRPLLLLLALGLQAGFLREWQLKETASAPVLVIGRILGVHRNERVPEDQLSWKAETWAMTADVEVLRYFSASRAPLISRRIEVRFLSYGPGVTMFINGNPPPLPEIKPDQIRILPLRENRKPTFEPWQLMADSGVNAILPARAETEREPAHSLSARAFLINELVKMLSRGTPGEVAAMSGYVFFQREDLSGDLMPLLSQAIGDNRQRWAEVAAGLYAAQGIPHTTVADLLMADPAASQTPAAWRGNRPLLRAVLRKLEPSPATDELLIRTWIANAPYYAWGSANSLIEYADNPVTTETLRQALRDDLSGSSYIALVLANHGNKTILPDATSRAFRVIDNPTGFGKDFSEVQGAAALLRDYGSNQDLMRLPAIVRKYQTLDPQYYGLLWQDATLSDNLREISVLAVVLADRRISSGSMRYCDYALGEFNRLTKQPFDLTAATVPERDAAISRALAWIRAH